MIVEYNKLPQKVKDIIDSNDEDKDDYLELNRIAEELKAIGWYMDYYLNAEITELRPMTKEVQKNVR